MPKKYGITYRLIADLVNKKEDTVKKYFHRRNWSITDVDNIRTYLRQNIYF